VTEREVLVRGSRPYTVRIGPGVLTGLPDALGGRQAFVLTDANVEPLHAGRLGELAAAPRLDPSGTSWLPFPFWLNGAAA